MGATERFSYLHPSAAQVVDERREWMRPLLERSRSPIMVDDGETSWWTYGGGRINNTFRYFLRALGHDVRSDNFRVVLDVQGLRDGIAELQAPGRMEELTPKVRALLPEYRLSKFQRALPEWASNEMFEAYLLDVEGARRVLSEMK